MLEEVLVTAPRRGPDGDGDGDGDDGGGDDDSSRQAAAAAAADAAGGGRRRARRRRDVAAAQVRALGALYREVHASLKQEVEAARAVFPRPDAVRGGAQREAGVGVSLWGGWGEGGAGQGGRWKG